MDCNNFFVSCERLFRPDLVGKPVVVLSSNDGCVVARSEEVKAAGIPMGMPHFKIKEDLKSIKATVFSSNFALYRDISARVMMVLRREVGAIEQYSIDEAFFEIPRRVVDLDIFATRIRDTIGKEIGIPISIGIATTKTLAKIANGREKRKSGVCVLSDELWHSIRSGISLSDVWGVGKATARSFALHQLHTVEDFCVQDPERISTLFGIQGTRLYAELQGRIAYCLSSVSEHQRSIMHTRSFQMEVKDPTVLADAIAYHVGEATAGLRRLGLSAGGIRVLLNTNRYGDHLIRGGSAYAVLSRPTDDTRVLLREAHMLLGSLVEKDVPYKKAGVVLDLLTESSKTQGTLFEDSHTDENTNELMKTVDALNSRFGRSVLSVGRISGAGMWDAKHNALSPAYTTRWSDIADAKAI